ncbi:MAG: hypothetical protein AB1502_00510, partial [Thermodesulfobacteriota bacterium]
MTKKILLLSICTVMIFIQLSLSTRGKSDRNLRARGVKLNEVLASQQDIQQVANEIQKRKNSLPSTPEYLFSVSSVKDTIATVWMDITSPILGKDLRKRYDDFYFAAIDYRGMAEMKLIHAQRFLNAQDIDKARASVKDSDRYLKLFYLSNGAAIDVFKGNIDSAGELARGIYNGSKASVKYGAGVLLSPWGSKVVDGVFLITDFAVDVGEIGVPEASKKGISNALVDAIFDLVKIKSLGGKTLSQVLTKSTTELVGSSQLYPILDDILKSPEFEKALMTVLAKSAAYVVKEVTKGGILSLQSPSIPTKTSPTVSMPPTSPSKKPIISKSILLGPYPSGQKYYLRVFNVDDVSKVKINGREILSVGYYNEREIAITGYLVEGKNSIELTLENIGGGWTYGYIIRQGNNVIWNESCGRVGIERCRNNDQTKGIVARHSINLSLTAKTIQQEVQAPTSQPPVLSIPAPKSEYAGSTPAVIVNDLLPKFRKVNDKIFAGGQPKNEEAVKSLANRGIKTIVNLESVIEEELKKEKEWAKKYNINYIWYPTPPTALPPVGPARCPTKNETENAIIIINNPNNQPVYIHCWRGIDRTGIVIATYRVKMEGWPVEAAINEWKKNGVLSLPDWEKCFRDYYTVTQPTPADKPPNVTSFSASASQINQGQSVTLSYSVSDDVGLKQVELWRADDTVGVGFREIKRVSISGKSYSGSISDTPPSAGTYRYGVHVVDTAGKWNCERNSQTNFSPGVYGPKQVIVKAPVTTPAPTPAPSDIRPPNVTSFSASSSQINQGQSITLSYRVTDDFGLKQVELWRADDTAGVGFREIKRVSVSGKTYTGFITDTPSSPGTYRYGLHVEDNSGKWNCERNSQTNYSPGQYGPKQVLVKA